MVRSETRDYDISYHTNGFKEALAKLTHHYQGMLDVEHIAAHLLGDLQLTSIDLQQKSRLI